MVHKECLFREIFGDLDKESKERIKRIIEGIEKICTVQKIDPIILDGKV